MHPAKTLALAGAALVVVAGVTYLVTRPSKPLITEKGEKRQKRRGERRRNQQPTKQKQSEVQSESQSSVVTSKPLTDTKEWTFEPLGIKLQIPSGWTAEEASEAATFITKFSGLTGQKSQALIVVESHQEKITPDEFLEKFKEVAQSMLPVQFQEEKVIEFADRKGFEAIYVQDLSAMGANFGNIKNYVCLTTVRNLGLCFQFTAAEEDFETDLETVKQVGKTLKMELPPSTSKLNFLSEDNFTFEIPSIQYESSKNPFKVSSDYEVITHLVDNSGADENSITVFKLSNETSTLDDVISIFKRIFEGKDTEQKDRSVLDNNGTLFTFEDKQNLCFVQNGKGYIIQVKGNDVDKVFDSIKSNEGIEASVISFRNNNLGIEFEFPPYMTVNEGVSQVMVTTKEGYPFTGITRTSIESLNNSEIDLNTVSQLVDQEVSQTAQQGLDISIENKENLTINGLDALRVVMKQKNPYVGVEIREVKTFIATPSGVMSVTSSTSADTYNDKVEEAFKAIASSFRSI